MAKVELFPSASMYRIAFMFCNDNKQCRQHIIDVYFFIYL